MQTKQTLAGVKLEMNRPAVPRSNIPLADRSSRFSHPDNRLFSRFCHICEPDPKDRPGHRHEAASQ
jgi:hypothetical protein